MGRFDWNKFSTECAGVVTKVGSQVTNVDIGDRVFGAAPGNFGNFVRVPGSSVQKMREGDKFEVRSFQCNGLIMWLMNRRRLQRCQWLT